MRYKGIYPNLEAAIYQLKRNKAEIARLIGVTPSTFSNKLTGRAAFTIDEMEIIKDYFSMLNEIEYTFDYLFRKEA